MEVFGARRYYSQYRILNYIGGPPIYSVQDPCRRGGGADEKCSLRQKIIVSNVPPASIHSNRSASRVINRKNHRVKHQIHAFLIKMINFIA